MERTSSWLIAIFIVMFGIFRVIVAVATESGSDFGGFLAFDLNMEIALIFVTVLSFILIVKRKLIGAILYLVSYVYYFGGYIYNSFLTIPNQINQNIIISIIAIILAISTLIDLIMDKIRKNKYTDSNTDWFFENKKTDRKIDDRVDKNQYKIY